MLEECEFCVDYTDQSPTFVIFGSQTSQTQKAGLTYTTKRLVPHRLISLENPEMVYGIV